MQLADFKLLTPNHTINNTNGVVELVHLFLLQVRQFVSEYPEGKDQIMLGAGRDTTPMFA